MPILPAPPPAMTAPMIANTAAAEAPVPEPRLGLFVSREDIAAARQRAATYPWAAEHRQRVLRIADAWVARSDAWVREIMPPPGARFAYGTAGCPHCGKPWGRFGEKLADLDRPLYLQCPECKTEFDLKNPSGPYADHGEGVLVRGQRFWLRGVWNAFVVNSMWSAFAAENGALVNLAEAYALTGDERYARKAAVLMDALATLAPQTRGPRDFDPDPNADAGRLQHLTSILFRAQVHFARALDLLGEHPALREPSQTKPGVSVWDNIRHGIFEEYLFVPIDSRGGKLHTLHNHEADSVRALILVGLLYGNAEYLRWGANGAQAFFDNVIDRDGLYYETSLSYTEFARSVYVDMAEMLARYDPAKYPADAKMPRREELPYHGNFFDHPNLARLILDTPERVSVLGRQPTYGNNHADVTVWKNPGRPFHRTEYQQTLRVLMHTSDPARRRTAAARAVAMLPFAGQKPIGGWWTLYRAPEDAEVRRLAESLGAPAPPTGDGGTPAVPEPERSDLFGQTGLVILRAGQGEARRAAVLRAGMNMPHAHDDQLGLLLFAQGRALSGDLGYGIFGNHVHLGWATRAIAHNTVVVNQDETSNNDLFRIGPGGTIHRFYDGPGLRLAEASLTRMFRPSDGVRDYRRTVLQVDLSPDASYWVDLFDVDGGRVHDYATHMKPLGPNGSFALEGATPQPVPGAWTLAGLDPKHRGAPFDAPGRAWGERLTAGGMIAKLPGVNDGVPDGLGRWYATPGNGYGFLYDVKRQEGVASPWSATWRWQEPGGEAHGLRLTLHPETPQQVITALGPTLTGTDKSHFVVARSGDPGSAKNGSVRTRYAAVLESFGGAAPRVSGSEALRAGGRVVGLRVRSEAAKRDDLILDARRGAVPAADGVPALDAGIGVVRRRAGALDGLFLTGGRALAADGFGLRFDTAVWSAKVTTTNDAAGTFRLSRPLPPSAVGALLTLDSPDYQHGSAYRVGAVSAAGDVTPLNAGLTLGGSRVDTPRPDGFAASAPLVFGFEYASDTGFLTGKRIVSGGKTGTVTGMTDFKTVRATGLQPRPGETFTVYDVKPGDDVRLDATASLVREADGEGEVWTLRSNLPVSVTLPWPAAEQSDAGGGWRRISLGRGGVVRVSAEELAAGGGTVRFRPGR
jgi:Heparinase II/III-like protein.